MYHLLVGMHTLTIDILSIGYLAFKPLYSKFISLNLEMSITGIHVLIFVNDATNQEVKIMKRTS